MPVATAAKVEALSADFRSAAALADMLGVSRSQVTRWLSGAGIDPANAEKVDLLELVWSNLLRLYEPRRGARWLFGLNPILGDRRPIDLIRAGRIEELMRAIRAERARHVRVILYRCFAWNERARSRMPLTGRSGFPGRTREMAATTTRTSTAASTWPTASRSRAVVEQLRASATQRLIPGMLGAAGCRWRLPRSSSTTRPS